MKLPICITLYIIFVFNTSLMSGPLIAGMSMKGSNQNKISKSADRAKGTASIHSTILLIMQNKQRIYFIQH
jgi:hypothetical protein